MTAYEENYNEIMDFLGKQKAGSDIYPKEFGLEYDELKCLIKKIENDGLIKAGDWYLTDKLYTFHGLTFDGQNFLQNKDQKQYPKIEKTEITYNNILNIHGNNYGNAVNGNDNTIQSPLDQKLLELIKAINKSHLSDKEQIIVKLQHSDKVGIQQTLGELLTRSSEVSSLVSMITGVLTLCI